MNFPRLQTKAQKTRIELQKLARSYEGEEVPSQVVELISSQLNSVVGAVLF